MSDIRIPHEGNVSTLIGTHTSYTAPSASTTSMPSPRISGDNHPNHMDDEYCKRMGFGGRIARRAP
ncbi:hypothetical protein ACTMU2_20785 [Cupriavidus basilensis]